VRLGTVGPGAGDSDGVLLNNFTIDLDISGLDVERGEGIGITDFEALFIATLAFLILCTGPNLGFALVSNSPCAVIGSVTANLAFSSSVGSDSFDSWTAGNSSRWLLGDFHCRR